MVYSMENIVWYKEVTDWQYPNHTYGLNPAGHMVAYIKASNGEMVMMKNPSKQFSKTRRKFQKVKV